MYKSLIGAAVILALSVPVAGFADPAKEAEKECREIAKEEEVPAEDMKSFMEECMAELMVSAEEGEESEEQPKSE